MNLPSQPVCSIPLWYLLAARALCICLGRVAALTFICDRLWLGFPPYMFLVVIFTTATGSQFSHLWELWSDCQCSLACISNFGLRMYFSFSTSIYTCSINLENMGTGTKMALEITFLFQFLFLSFHQGLERSGPHENMPSLGWHITALSQCFWPLSFSETNWDLDATKCTDHFTSGTLSCWVSIHCVGVS